MTTPQSVEEVENNIRSEIAGLAGMLNGSLIQDSGQAHIANMKLGKILEHIDSLTTLLAEREAEVRREERERILKMVKRHYPSDWAVEQGKKEGKDRYALGGKMYLDLIVNALTPNTP